MKRISRVRIGIRGLALCQIDIHERAKKLQLRS